MGYIKTIKMIRESKGLTEAEKNSFIRRGILEVIINSWKIILKLPFYLIKYLCIVIGAGAEKIEDLFYSISNFFENILYKIDGMKTIYLCTLEEIEHLKEVVEQEHTCKVKTTNLKK